MTEARLVTRADIRALLIDFEGPPSEEYLDRVWAALPAAAPAEGSLAILSREHKRNSGHDFDPKCGYCAMLAKAAAPAEGLREALRHYDPRIEPSISTGDMSAREWRDAYFELARIALRELEDCRAALARQGEAELSEFRHHESAGSE